MFNQSVGKFLLCAVVGTRKTRKEKAKITSERSSAESQVTNENDENKGNPGLLLTGRRQPNLVLHVIHHKRKLFLSDDLFRCASQPVKVVFR